MKRFLSNELLLYPCPVVLVTTKHISVENVFTVSWIGIACSHPEFLSISVKPTRYSHRLIQESGLFTVNIIDENLLQIADYCGSVSGISHDKFAECGLKKTPGISIDVPMLEACPINIECVVEHTLALGGHDLIVGRVVSKMIDANIPDTQIHEKLQPVSYFRPNYYGIDKTILGQYGTMGSPFRKK